MTLTPSDFSSAEDSFAQSQAHPGTAPPEPFSAVEAADTLLGRNVGHFRVESRLGSGAMAAVYRATDLILERQVALKVLLPGADDVVRERFRQEARTVSVLDHPNIVRTLQVGLTDGITYIAMDLVEGTNLAELLGEYGRLSLVDSCRLLEPMARALAYAHRQHVIHRDVKPSNILLRRLPSAAPQAITLAPLTFGVIPLLSDFGIALALDSPELTAAGRTVGTPTYMAPEQAADSHEIDGRADIYALGIVLYRCLVGRPPFVGSTTQILHAHVYEPLTIPDAIAGQLPPLVLEIMQRMLAKDPGDRYADAAVLAGDLALVAGSDHPQHIDPPTATMPSLASTSHALGNERQQVLVPAPGSRTVRRIGALPANPLTAGKSETSLRPAPARVPKRKRNWVGLALGSTLALLLVIFGILLLRTVFPLDRLFVRSQTPSGSVTPGATPDAPLAQAPTTPMPPFTSTDAPLTPGKLSTRLEAPMPESPAVGTPEPPTGAAETPVLTPAATIAVDVELYWELVSEDFNRRDWNKALGNLILILRSQSNEFNQGLARGEKSQAELVHDLLLTKPDAPLWAQWGSLFDPERIKDMLFHIYIGLATVGSAERAQQRALGFYNEALVLKPDNVAVRSLRDATQQFLTADDTDREEARRALGLTLLQYSDTLYQTDDACGASEQLDAAVNVLPNTNLEPRLATLRQECDDRQETLAGQRLLADLSGGILYSTQEGDTYHIYWQPLIPEATPTLLVSDGRQPKVSPDGRHLAYYSTRANAMGIASVDLTDKVTVNGAPTQLTTTPADASDSPPTWSFDNGRIAFASVREQDGRSRIYVKPAVTDDTAKSLAVGLDPAWRPLGESWIVYSGRGQANSMLGLWLITDDGLRWRQLTNNERDRRPAWSPNAETIVFMSDGRDNNWELYRLTLSRDHAVIGSARLTNRPAQDGLPAISPDGSYVAFMSDQGGRWRIWVAPLDGSAKPLPVADIRGSLTQWLEHGIQWVAN